MRIAIEGPRLNLMKFWISVLINIVAKILGGGGELAFGGDFPGSPPPCMKPCVVTCTEAYMYMYL